ncbi:MAG: class I SAM-dependent methyltransferase [Nanoarchaeota archaeon]
MKDKRLVRLEQGKNRGKNVEQVFKLYKNDFKNLKILDIGCGFGSLTLDFAKEFKKVHSIDAGNKQIETTKKRVKENNLKNVSVHKDNALNLKTTNDKFDIIHLTGVFEWLRAGDLNKSAYQTQNIFLKNIKNNMNDDAILYSGTENKGFPFFWIKDPHNDKWPLMVLLPEKLSDFIFKIFKNRKYTAKIYTYWTLKKMFKKHFKKVDFYIPIPHYQYVFEFADINNRKEIIQKCNKVLKTKKLDFKHKVSVKWIKWTTRFGLIKLFTPGFITVVKK